MDSVFFCVNTSHQKEIEFLDTENEWGYCVRVEKGSCLLQIATLS